MRAQFQLRRRSTKTVTATKAVSRSSDIRETVGAELAFAPHVTG
jgi:hypothetical protein